MALKSIAYSKVHTPVEAVLAKVAGEDASITRAEIKLQDKRNGEFILQTEDAVYSAFAVTVRVSVYAIRINVQIASPRIADTSAQSDESVQVASESSFVHEIGS